MSDSTIKKVKSDFSPTGDKGQAYLVSGKRVSMRVWKDVPATDEKPTGQHDYETVGYVIDGAAELHLEGQTVRLEAGDSWLVPKGAEHSYAILEPFTAVEATSSGAADCRKRPRWRPARRRETNSAPARMERAPRR